MAPNTDLLNEYGWIEDVLKDLRDLLRKDGFEITPKLLSGVVSQLKYEVMRKQGVENLIKSNQTNDHLAKKQLSMH